MNETTATVVQGLTPEKIELLRQLIPLDEIQAREDGKANKKNR